MLFRQRKGQMNLILVIEGFVSMNAKDIFFKRMILLFVKTVE